MRTLRLVVSRSKGALPALVLAAVLPAGAGCSRSPLGADAQGSTGHGGAGSTSSSQSAGGAGGGGGFVSSSSSSSTGTGGGLMCDPGAFEQTFTVELPPDGVPAT